MGERNMSLKAIVGSARYHVWEMGVRDRTQPMRHINRRPLVLQAAKPLARIGAKEGKHDRAVTTSPKSRDFRVVAQYEAGTGDNVTSEVYRGRPRRRVTIEE
jgi:hypothetical protein